MHSQAARIGAVGTTPVESYALLMISCLTKVSRQSPRSGIHSLRYVSRNQTGDPTVLIAEHCLSTV